MRVQQQHWRRWLWPPSSLMLLLPLPLVALAVVVLLLTLLPVLLVLVLIVPLAQYPPSCLQVDRWVAAGHGNFSPPPMIHCHWGR